MTASKPCSASAALPLRDLRRLVSAKRRPSVCGFAQGVAPFPDRLVGKSLEGRIFDAPRESGRDFLWRRHALAQPERSFAHAHERNVGRYFADDDFTIARLDERPRRSLGALHDSGRRAKRGAAPDRKRHGPRHVDAARRHGETAVPAGCERRTRRLGPEPLVAQIRLHLQPVVFLKRRGEEDDFAEPSPALPVAVRIVGDVVVRKQSVDRPAVPAGHDVEELPSAAGSCLVHGIDGDAVNAEHSGQQYRPSGRVLDEGRAEDAVREIAVIRRNEHRTSAGIEDEAVVSVLGSQDDKCVSQIAHRGGVAVRILEIDHAAARIPPEVDVCVLAACCRTVDRKPSGRIGREFGRVGDVRVRDGAGVEVGIGIRAAAGFAHVAPLGHVRRRAFGERNRPGKRGVEPHRRVREHGKRRPGIVRRRGAGHGERSAGDDDPAARGMDVGERKRRISAALLHEVAFEPVSHRA